MEEELTNHQVQADDWVIFKFCGKKRIRYFVGLIYESNDGVFTVKFARRIEDISMILMA